MKSKVTGSKSMSFIKGGSHSMLGKKHAGTQQPGQTTAGGAGSDSKVIKGGSGHMVGKTSTGTATPGQTGPARSATGKWAEGGSGHMCGKGTAGTARPA